MCVLLLLILHLLLFGLKKKYFDFVFTNFSLYIFWERAKGFVVVVVVVVGGVCVRVCACV